MLTLSYPIDLFPAYGVWLGPLMIITVLVCAACFAVYPSSRKRVLVFLGVIGSIEFFLSFTNPFLVGIMTGLSTLTCGVVMSTFYFSSKPEYKNVAGDFFVILGFIEFFPCLTFFFSNSAGVWQNWLNLVFLMFFINSIVTLASAVRVYAFKR